ncbi:MAG: hypothetical protein K2W85_07170 [Phycisphaerales bacterium]|nr:hypothetical protein [Phycisphaerales bacterium]
MPQAQTKPASPAPADQPKGMQAVGVRRFPCAQCGAKLEYQPGSTVLVCPYCSAQNQIGPAAAPDDSNAHAVEEIDYVSTLHDLANRTDKFQHLTVKCDACAAEIEAAPNATAFPCPFCASNIVATAQAATHIKPNAILPFKMNKEDARTKFRTWLKSLWFAPSKLKSEGYIDACFTGTYVPAWTYDSETTTRYTGQRGEAYYETVYTTVNGRRQSQRVRKVRWYPAAGVVHVGFDDVLVMASTSISEPQLEELDPWDLRDCVPYADEYLAGFRSECYQVPLEVGFEKAKKKMQFRIDATICRDIGGDEQRISSKSTQYNAITFKHVLLPIWLSAYRFNNKVFRFMVNARTGEVVGERPWSALKITLFVLSILLGILVLVIIAKLGSR